MRVKIPAAAADLRAAYQRGFQRAVREVMSVSR